MDVFPAAYRPFLLANIRPWTWFVLDFLIAYASATLAFNMTPYNFALGEGVLSGDHVAQMPFSLGFALVVALAAHIIGLHESTQHNRSFGLLSRCFAVSVISIVLINGEMLVVHYQTVGRLISIFTLVACTLGLTVVRALIVGLATRNRHVVAFVGSDRYIDRAYGYVSNQPAPGIQLERHSTSNLDQKDLKSWVVGQRVHEVVVDTNDPEAPSETELLSLVNSNLTVTTYTTFIENLLERVPSEHINAQWIIDCQSGHAMLYKRAVKRGLDIIVATAALLFLLPLIGLAAIAIKLDSGGPVIFRQKRVGQFGQVFTMLKLRSMVSDAESQGAQWATQQDCRVTPVGNFLRRSRLDEAPQLLNVIAGTMSLVGPRPERPEFTEQLERTIPYFVNRLLVKPGITGWAQINSGYAASQEDSVNKLSFDLYYVKKLSFSMDLRILLRTISSFASGSR